MHKILRTVAAFIATFAALAATTAWAQAPVTTQRVQVNITPGVYADIGDAEMRRRVGLLIADVNAVFAQQTRRRFSIDTVNDIHPYPPNTLFPTFFPDSLDTTVVLNITDSAAFGGTYSTGPHRFAPGGSILMTGVTHLHDPFNLPTDNERSDYLSIQLRGLVHEFEHTFGAGLGEYYELTHIVDDTAFVAPRIDVDFFENYPGQPTDPYWSQHLEYIGDPLFTIQYGNPRLGSPTTREAVIAATKFTRGTLSIVDADFVGLRPTMDPNSALLAPRNAVHVTLVDRETGLPIAAAGGAVEVFQYSASLFGTATGFQIRGQAYDPATPWTFSWPGLLRGFNFGENRVLVKGQAPGYLPDGVWFSIFDVWDQIVVEGRPVVEIKVPMSRVDAPMPTMALVSPAAGGNVENGGNTTFTFDLAAAEGLRSFTIETADGFPVCLPHMYAPGVLADRASCVGALFGVTGDTPTLVLKVTDQARRTVSQQYTFRLVDTTGPDLTLFPIWGGSPVLNSRQPTQALVEYFDVSGVSRYQLTMGTQTLCAATVAAGDPGDALCPWTAPRIPEGTMSTATLTLSAWDRLGNASSTSATVTVDAQAPTLRVMSPLQNATVRAGTDVTFVVDAQDAGGMDSLDVVASGQMLCFTMDAPFSCTVTIPADWDGGKEFKVTAHDAAGNKTTVEVDLYVLKATN